MSKNVGDKRFITTTTCSVRVAITRLGISRHFRFSEYGECAHACAIHYRNRVLENENLGFLMHSQPREKSKGGACALAGVELKIEPHSSGRGTNAAFTAYFKVDDGVYRRRSFSIRKYGYCGAFERAVEVRLAMTKLPIDPDTIPLPRPRVDQFIFLLSIATDVPTPYICKGK